jgi:hypothetical protein
MCCDTLDISSASLRLPDFLYYTPKTFDNRQQYHVSVGMRGG